MQCQSLVKECLLTHSLPSGFFPKSFKRWLGNLARPCARPLHLPLRVNLLSQLKGRIMHPNPENLHLHAWLLSRRESDRANNHISKAVRQSTEIVYDAKWSIFVNWCVGREIDPIKISVQQLADFFVHLFEDKGLLPSTIKYT